VHYVLRVNYSNLGVETSKYLYREGNYGHFSSKATNDSVWRVVGPVSTIHTACIIFCGSNTVTGALSRRNISTGMKIAPFLVKIDELSRLARYGACFDA
jgi:hypothetical protein